MLDILYQNPEASFKVATLSTEVDFSNRQAESVTLQEQVK